MDTNIFEKLDKIDLISSMEEIKNQLFMVIREDNFQPEFFAEKMLDNPSLSIVLGINKITINNHIYYILFTPEDYHRNVNENDTRASSFIIVNDEFYDDVEKQKLKQNISLGEIDPQYEEIDLKDLESLAYRAFNAANESAKQAIENIPKNFDNYALLSELKINTPEFKNFLNEYLNNL